MPDEAGLQLDYARWRGEHRQWESIDSFLDAPQPWMAGVHSIGVDGLPLDIFVANPERLVGDGQAVLPVFFSAAIGTRAGQKGPFFSGGGLAASGRYAAICVADPSLALSSKLSLAWYAGSASQHTQSRVQSLLSGIARRLKVELLLIGGSGGGFAALHFGSRLEEMASVLVWNPQTNLLRYYRSAVDRYLEACFPHEAQRGAGMLRAAPGLLSRAGIEYEVVTAMAAGRMPRRLIYLQNSDDAFHIERHTSTFLERIATDPAGDGCSYRNESGTAMVWIRKWGKGHDAPPKPLLAEAVSLLLDREAPVSDVVNVLRRSLDLPELPNAPSFLRFSQLPVAPSFSVEAHVSDRKLEVRASLSGLPDECTPPTFAFYVMCGSERVETRWYQSAPKATFSLRDERQPTRVVAFARDCAGEKLQVVGAIEAQETDTPATKVAIVGSCVSRDAFAEQPAGMELVRYFARSSLASALRRSPAVLDVDLARIESEWQRRMVQYDLERRIVHDLREIPFDVLLLDFIDERFNIALVDGEPVTVSNELLRAGFDPARFRLLGHGDPTRMRFWTEGVALLMGLIGTERVVVNRVYWATHDNTGRALDGHEKILAANQALDRMYSELLRNFAVRTIDYPRKLLVADASHKWGLSPFHYVSAVYEHTISRLRELAGS